ncbi:hypothetical protein BHYA_0084g00310 [Botrytis hyacinthi]|uniref:2EXR domain-containing protein n=1 Tax=Botrytis hyacinthi TaxID=278943 RepID=A0A4Z1GS32_9HELO|nr:hypothetical protein BHYA_0084g00310 [Botrytis hyacinthi]
MPRFSKTYSRARGGFHQRACNETRIGARGSTNISSYRPGFGGGFRHPFSPEVTSNSFLFSECYQCRSMQDIRLQRSIAESADTDLSSTIPKFQQFPFLPVEIQSKIWSFAALHPCIIPILTHWIPLENLDESISPFENAGSINITTLSRISPLLHTCSTSRAIALRKYCLLGNEPRYLGEDLFDDEHLDENGLLIDGNYEITRGFYVNPSVDIIYFTSHVEDHYFKYNTHWNVKEPKDLNEGIFAETFHFPVEDVLDLLKGSTEIDKEIRYLAFDLDLPGVGHRILGDYGLSLSPIGSWTGLKRVIFCLGGVDGVDNAAENDEFSEDSKGKGRETPPVDKKHGYSSSVIDFEETKLYGIGESFTGPSAGKGNALFKKCMSKYSQFSGDLVSQSEEWFECLKPSGSLGVDGRPAVSYTGTLGLGALERNGDEGEERLDILPVIGFGVVSNYVSGEERRRWGLEENPFEKMCYDRYASFEKDEANEKSVFGCSVVMGED